MTFANTWGTILGAGVSGTWPIGACAAWRSLSPFAPQKSVILRSKRRQCQCDGALATGSSVWQRFAEPAASAVPLTESAPYGGGTARG